MPHPDDLSIEPGALRHELPERNARPGQGIANQSIDFDRPESYLAARTMFTDVHQPCPAAGMTHRVTNSFLACLTSKRIYHHNPTALTASDALRIVSSTDGDFSSIKIVMRCLLHDEEVRSITTLGTGLSARTSCTVSRHRRRCREFVFPPGW